MSVGIAPNKGDGFELLDGGWAQGLAGGQNNNTQTVIAHAGGGQASAVPIGPNTAFAYISTVASAADSVALPRAKKGQVVFVLNGTATSANLYAYNGSSDKINGTAGSTAFAIAGNKSAYFFCPSDGFWGAIVTP